MIYAIAILSPLAGCLLAGIFGRRFGDTYAKIVTIGFMILAALCAEISLSQVLFAEQPPEPVILATWFDIGGFRLDWALRRDTLSSAMVAMVAPVATLIHIYSVGYMAHERRSFRFFAYLSLFTFAMLMLVTANNLVQLFFGWEGVGLASYLLIGYWYDRPSANRAAMKAFIVNRVGDLFFAVGIALVFQPVRHGRVPGDLRRTCRSTRTRSTTCSAVTWRAYEVIGILLFIGAMGKSAQIGLHTWLPDAMEGPTPVSALIHAATMVTAGVFLMARMSLHHGIGAPGALNFVLFIGGEYLHLRRHDRLRADRHQARDRLLHLFAARLHVHRGRALSAYQASVFHLITHAFFKALLFLCAGSVIHAMSDEQDMRKMGGIWRKVPMDLWLHVGRQPGHRRHPLLRRLLVEGRDPRGDLGFTQPAGRLRLSDGCAGCLPHRLLLVAPHHHDVPWHAAGGQAHDGACSREHALDGRPPRHPGVRRGLRRLVAAWLVHRRGPGRVLGRRDPCRRQQPCAA